MSFPELGLRAELLTAIEKQNYDTPTPIQRQAIPAVLEGRDMLAGAQTGTGKTAAFALPILQMLSTAGHSRARRGTPRTLVLAPTRELAAQVGESFTTYGQHLALTSAVVFGGVNINPQKERLTRSIDILVATPGRLLDLAGQRAIDLGAIQILVLDEADRMLDMGFIHDIRRVLKLLPRQRQNLLFSATYSDDIRRLADSILDNPAQIEVARRNTAAHTVEQFIYNIDKADKKRLLVHLLEAHGWYQVLVFTRTKHGANQLTKFLQKHGIEAAAIHGNKSQGARTRALATFKNGELRVLVATDIAARGLDIERLPHVVNFELPNVAEDYVHRIGRTGRAGESGHAISLVMADERKQLRAIERLLKKSIPVLEVPGELKLPEPVAPQPTTAASPPTKGQPGGANKQKVRASSGGDQRRRHHKPRNLRSGTNSKKDMHSSPASRR